MNVLKPSLKTTIKTLLSKEISQREIERKTGIDRKTIRRYTRLSALSATADADDSKSPTSPEVATGSNISSLQNPPPRPPAAEPKMPKHVRSACESHREWIEEQVDLTPYAGREVLLRVEYVTDQSYSARGLLLDDLRVPELGLTDTADRDQDWTSEGFIRSENQVAHQFAARLILVREEPPEVVDLALDDLASGSLHLTGLHAPGARAVLAISSLTRGTLEPAPYTIELRPTDS